MVELFGLWRRTNPRARLLVLGGGFMVPPLAGMVLIEQFFGGLGPGLWVLAGIFFLFGATVVIGLARAAREGSGPDCFRQSGDTASKPTPNRS